jgi:hypothetical protein
VSFATEEGRIFEFVFGEEKEASETLKEDGMDLG